MRNSPHISDIDFRDINRNMVGVNPFGGQGLSGTGPKAGGPYYLPRFATEKTRTDNVGRPRR